MIDFEYFDYGENETVYASTRDTKIDIEYIIRKLNNKWEDKNIPLMIDIIDSKIRISHKYPDNVENSAQLRLHPSLAYILGYNEERTDLGQYLRFDESTQYIAPHYPKSFMDHEQHYLIDIMLMIEGKFNRQEQKIRKIFDDCMDRGKKGVTPIAHFEKVKPKLLYN